jgi:CDP-glucose 4,6-dehydratase
VKLSDINLSASYKGKKVLLTGHTGFKGAWMLQWLKLLQAEVCGLALNPLHENDLYHLINGDTLCHSIIHPIEDYRFVEQTITSFQPDFIFHFAAQPLVRQSYLTPVETFQTNAIGTLNILNALRNLDKPCAVVLITTDKVYENKEHVFPYREIDALGGYDPYSASKACAEIIINSYRSSFFNPSQYDIHKKGIASARAGNVIGGGDWSADRIIPDIINALSENKQVVLRNPFSTRPWQHVIEPLGGYLMLGAKLANNPIDFSGAWNFGPLTTDVSTVEDLTKAAIKIWGSGDYVVNSGVNQPHEANLLSLDISKSVHQLKWQPRYNSTTAIKLTVQWYKDYLGKKLSASELVITTINNYLNS